MLVINMIYQVQAHPIIQPENTIYKRFQSANMSILSFLHFLV